MPTSSSRRGWKPRRCGCSGACITAKSDLVARWFASLRHKRYGRPSTQSPAPSPWSKARACCKFDLSPSLPIATSKGAFRCRHGDLRVLARGVGTATRSGDRSGSLGCAKRRVESWTPRCWSTIASSRRAIASTWLPSRNQRSIEASEKRQGPRGNRLGQSEGQGLGVR